MTLVKCPNGHYYDSSRFGNNCPHCGMGGAANVGGDQTTVPLNLPDAPVAPSNTATEPLNVTAAQAPIPTPVPTPAPAPVVNPAPAPMPAPAPVTVQRSYAVGEKTVDNDRTLPVTADMLDGAVERPAPVVGWLVCTDGMNKGTDYRLHQGRNFIGRSTEMDVCIMGDNTVSRSSHAIVVYDPRGNVYLAQPGSSKELFYVNDALVLNPVELKAMDILSLGDTKLMFVPLCGEKFHW